MHKFVGCGGRKSFSETYDRQTIARYITKNKSNGNRSERKKCDWYAVVTINLDTIKQQIFLKNMEKVETTVENNDCAFADIGGVKQFLSDGNRS